MLTAVIAIYTVVGSPLFDQVFPVMQHDDTKVIGIRLLCAI